VYGHVAGQCHDTIDPATAGDIGQGGVQSRRAVVRGGDGEGIGDRKARGIRVAIGHEHPQAQFVCRIDAKAVLLSGTGRS